MQNFVYFSSAKFWKQTTKSRLILTNSLKKLEGHHSSRQNLGIENFTWYIQNIQKVFGNIQNLRKHKILLFSNQGNTNNNNNY